MAFAEGGGSFSTPAPDWFNQIPNKWTTAQIKDIQVKLGVTADGAYGPKTKAAHQAYFAWRQKSGADSFSQFRESRGTPVRQPATGGGGGASRLGTAVGGASSAEVLGGYDTSGIENEINAANKWIEDFLKNNPFMPDEEKYKNIAEAIVSPFIEDKLQQVRQVLERALEDGRITEEQAHQDYTKTITYLKEDHDRNVGRITQDYQTGTRILGEEKESWTTSSTREFLDEMFGSSSAAADAGMAYSGASDLNRRDLKRGRQFNLGEYERTYQNQMGQAATAQTRGIEDESQLQVRGGETAKTMQDRVLEQAATAMQRASQDTAHQEKMIGHERDTLVERQKSTQREEERDEWEYWREKQITGAYAGNRPTSTNYEPYFQKTYGQSTEQRVQLTMQNRAAAEAAGDTAKVKELDDYIYKIRGY